MKKLLGILIVTTITTASLASTSQNGNEHFGKPIVTAIRHPTATRNAQVRVKIQKPKLFVGHPYKITVFATDWDDDFLDLDDIITPYRRRDLTKIEHEDGISDNVRWRLFLARQLALLKHRETFGEKIS